MDSIPLSSEALWRVQKMFTGDDLVTATELLTSECGVSLPLVRAQSPEDLDRFRFAALKMSNGNLAELRRAIAIAKQDWRDLLVAAGFGNDPLAHERWLPECHKQPPQS